MKVGPGYVVVAPHLTRLPLVQTPETQAVVRKAIKAEQQTSTHERMLAEKGRENWAKLHRRALAKEGQDDAAFITAFGNSLPCGVCKTHWYEMLARTPPDFSRYFGWSVDRHNEVNARLPDKPQVSEAAARSLWNEPGDAIATPPQAG